ncbi:four helix bundle protein [Polaribacter gangjinensis]|uniref:Four helix bundle protein n=1 Tax=Polaribacter gangjinensis TaxID=574710 RepID=A0A2S7WFA6_9FLAO|nr:four helix bundle protein [Polaribacter gangjinensis]PQJ76106.1 four helix bundle protein [Polaribacter gangjinensis]
MKTFKELLVWQKSMLLVTEIYKVSKDYPKEELFGLSSQIRRSAISIPSNIAEGFGRDGLNDFIRFLNISMSSLFELQTQIEISYNLNYINIVVFEDLYKSTREIERMLSSLIKRLKTKKDA